ncbi:MAG: hypothetical protein A2W31_11095 [Planctomycetes bacterium RBG_16_64_10]|nr:MAG: hypothetical protein A2W31_11095 [Planctomycetes bacterium RBG_16_64_10]
MAGPTVSLDQIVRRARQLYSLPAVAIKLLELTSSPQVDNRALKQCIENDPALTAKVLRVVNSSLFGLSRPVGDLHQCLALLGMKPLKLLVLGFSLPDRLLSGIVRDQLARYWRDTLTKAVAAREISETLWRLPGDEAFLGGLLGGIGMLVLIQDLQAPYSDFLDRVECDGEDLRALEKQWLGFDHVTLSARLLAHWRLPKWLIAAVAAPRSPARLRRLPAPFGPLAQIMYLSDLLVSLVARHRIGVLPDLLEAGTAFCGLTRSGLTELVRCLEPKVAQLAELLSLDLPPGLDYCGVLTQAHRQLADEVCDAVHELVGGGHGQLGGGLESTRAGLPPAPPVRAAGGGGPNAAEFGPPTGSPRWPTARLVATPGKPAEAPSWETDAVDQPDKAAAVLLGCLTAMVTCCRSQRRELSLLLIEINHRDRSARARNTQITRFLMHRLEATVREAGYPDAVIVRLTRARFAVVLPHCDRGLAVAMGRCLIDVLAGMASDRAHHAAPLPTLRIGAATVAVPPKNFSARALIESAERCLYAARSSRTSSIKSIEVY